MREGVWFDVNVHMVDSICHAARRRVKMALYTMALENQMAAKIWVRFNFLSTWMAQEAKKLVELNMVPVSLLYHVRRPLGASVDGKFSAL